MIVLLMALSFVPVVNLSENKHFKFFQGISLRRRGGGDDRDIALYFRLIFVLVVDLFKIEFFIRQSLHEC